jgi:ribosomal protein L40E
MTSCVNCSADLPAGAKFCKKCGTPVAASVDASPCLVCKADLPAGAKFCKKCGAPVTGAVPLDAVLSTSEPETERVAEAGTITDVPMPPVDAPSSETPSFERPAPSTALESTSVFPEAPEQSDQKQLKMIVAGVVVVAVIAAGLFWWHGSKKAASAEPVPATLPAPIVDSAPVVEQVIPASPTLPDLGKPHTAVPPAAANAVAPSVSEAPAAGLSSPPMAAPEAAMAPMRPQPAPAQTPKIGKPAQQADPMAGTIATLLGKADSYIANGQYDKAVATGESVLAIDPGSRAAKAVISKAKARQIDALRSNSSLE